MVQGLSKEVAVAPREGMRVMSTALVARVHGPAAKVHKEEEAETRREAVAEARRMRVEVVHQEGMRGMSTALVAMNTALAAKVRKVEEAAVLEMKILTETFS